MHGEGSGVCNPLPVAVSTANDDFHQMTPYYQDFAPTSSLAHHPQPLKIVSALPSSTMGDVPFPTMEHPGGFSQRNMILSRKRKQPDDEDTKHHLATSPMDQQKKYIRQNHSEIEKRRRDKMNNYINELSSLIPTCVAMARKMDKLTVLRLAVQHLKTLRGSINSYTEGMYKPNWLSDQELKQLILLAADDGFLFVVDSARGRILYVSESVNNVLNYSQSDLFGQSLFDILHPKDIAKVKEQLSSSDLTPRERLIDSKTMQPVGGGDAVNSPTNRLSPGARRSFFCRMKAKSSMMVKEETGEYSRPRKTTTSERKYSVIQCTGYLKSWALTKMGDELNDDTDPCDTSPDGTASGSTCMSCLVAVCRLQPSLKLAISDSLNRGQRLVQGVEFTARFTIDGKFSFVDQRVTVLLGFLPQELQGTSLYEHIQYDDIPAISECHRKAIKFKDEQSSAPFRFRKKDGSFVSLVAKWKHFRNPWTKDIEYLISRYSLLLTNDDEQPSFKSLISTSQQQQQSQSYSTTNDMDFFSSGSNGVDPSTVAVPNGEPSTIGRSIQRVITSHAEATKIGRQIAEETKESLRYSADSSSNSPISNLLQASPMSVFNTPSHSPLMSGMMQEAFAAVEEEQRLSNNPSEFLPASEPVMKAPPPVILKDQTDHQFQQRPQGGPPTNGDGGRQGNDGNDEAAMAVIMSLLEADAGLGGPVDFSGLPWPLP